MTTKKAFVSQGVVLFSLLAALAACAAGPKNPDAEGMIHIAQQLQAKGDDAGAAAFYERALQRAPNDTETRLALAKIFETHGDEAAAAMQYSTAINQDPDNGELHRDLGRVLIRMNQPAAAKDQFEKALAIDSDDTKAMNGLGIALDYLGQHEAAQRTYKDVLAENPDDLSVMNNLARSYIMVGAYREAITLLEPHIRDKGATPALRQNLAEAYGMAGMDTDAERVGLMDLTPAQVKHNLDYYHARRAQLDLEPKLYADLGNFATEAMANARKREIETKFAHESAGLILETMPEVKISGGTPDFVLRACGFARAEKLRNFCGRLKKAGLSCKAHGA